jgi:hypothetical protein
LLEYFITLIYLWEQLKQYCILLIQTAFSKNNIALLFVIAAAGVTLSILSYQYSSFIASERSKAASQDGR